MMENIETKKVMIAVPAMDTVSTHFAVSLYNLHKPCLTKLEVVSNSLIYDARNILAAEAIDDECDYVLWIDSDMVFTSDLLTKLLNDIEGRDYVGALTFTRKFPTKPTLYKFDNRGENVISSPLNDYPKDQIFQVDATGFGTVITSTKLLKSIFDEFNTPFTPTHGLGEDLSFCYRAGQLGYKIWCDSSIKIGHVGRYIFSEKDFRK